MSKSSKTEQIKLIVDQTLAGTPFELVLLEYRKEGSAWVLRLYIDHTEGVNLDHCAEVSHLVSGALDEADMMADAYTIEVSSPGVDRPLVELAHFQRFVGERVFVKLSRKTEGIKQVTGILRHVHGEEIEVESEIDGQLHKLPLELVAKATLKPILEF